MKKKLLALTLIAVMSFALVAGCAGGNSGSGTSEGSTSETPAPEKTPEELTALYKDAIESARDQETNDVIPVISAPDAEMADFILPMVGVTAENAEAFGVAVSPMNVKAYGIAIVKPAEGKAEEVKAGLEGFIALQLQNFEMYLPDQYEIAQAARLETLADGTMVMVMCDGQDDVFASIQSTLDVG